MNPRTRLERPVRPFEQETANTGAASEPHISQDIPKPIGSAQSVSSRGGTFPTRRVRPASATSRKSNQGHLIQDTHLSPMMIIQILLAVLLTTLLMHITRRSSRPVIRIYTSPPSNTVPGEPQTVTETVTTTIAAVETKTETASYPTITAGCNCVPFRIEVEPGMAYDGQDCPPCPGAYLTEDGPVYFIPVRLAVPKDET